MPIADAPRSDEAMRMQAHCADRGAAYRAAVLTVPCGRCGAARGSPCSGSDTSRTWQSHYARVQTWRAEQAWSFGAEQGSESPS